MKYKKILLTGGSGKLGHAIVSSNFFPQILAPSHNILDLTKSITVEKFFEKNDFDSLIHCAALARMTECETDPIKAVQTNILGTINLVVETIKKETKKKKKIRFVHISTDGVYPGTKGNYSEVDEAIPYNKYGWTKLGAECAVRLLSDFCIIRTSFFDPEKIAFKESAVDAYSSKIPIDYLVKAIAKILESNFTGVINLGSERKSDYERYKEFKPSLKPCNLKDILKKVPFAMARDASMDTSLWRKIEKMPPMCKRIRNVTKLTY
ncbi:MAG: sugar nucleotide-binding protein [Nanoarchaeota archaeon]